MTNRNLGWLRLEEVINRANMTVNSFGRHIGLSRSESLYQLKAGRFGISHNLAQRIVEKFPEISLGWLLSGEGKMYLPDGTVETLLPGDCHYCPEGTGHSFVNESDANLTFFAVVPVHAK